MGLQLQMVSIRQAYNIQNNIKDTIINISLNQFSDSWTLDHKDLHIKHFCQPNCLSVKITSISVL